MGSQETSLEAFTKKFRAAWTLAFLGLVFKISQSWENFFMVHSKESEQGLLENPSILIRFRWAALLVQGVCVYVGYEYQVIDRDQMFLSALLILSAIFLNAFCSWFKPPKSLNFFQMLFDLSLAFGLLYLTGGLENPFYLILMIHLFLAPFFLCGISLFALGGIAVCYLYLLQFTDYPFSNEASWFVYDHVKLVSALTVSAVIWQAARWLVLESRRLNQRILNLENFNRKIEKYRALGFLAAGVSHEIGTPLNTAQIRVDRLMRGSELKEDEDLRVAQKSLQKTKAALKKLNDGLQELQEEDLRERLDLKKLLKEITDAYEESLDCKVHLKFLSTNGVYVEFPRLFLSRSIGDLLDNAVEAGAQNIWIEVSESRQDPQWWDITVKDDGEGFNEEVLKRLGEPFVSSKKQGTGLGLYHLINLISYLGGEIKIRNIEANGKSRACIKISLKAVQ